MELLLVGMAVLAGLAALLRMVPTQAVAERAMILLGADSTTLNKSSGSANLMILFQNPATPGPQMVMADFTEADFDGYAARDVLYDGLPESIDPVTGDILISVPPETTAYLWETTGLTNLPQTIYGYAIVNSTKTTVYAAERFDEPIELNAVNQSISIPGMPRLRMVNGSIS